MACFSPLVGVDFGIQENGKHKVKIIPPGQRSIYELRQLYNGRGADLMLLPCGHCIGCASDYARAWQCRIMCEFEGRKEEGNSKGCFLTLTYDDLHYKNDSDYVKKELRTFIKSLRNKFGNGIQFFACTERGSETHRLHHHAIIFGIDFGEDRVISAKRGLFYTYKSPLLESLWHRGFCSLGSLDVSSAGYVSKYCDKKKISRTNEGESVIMSRGLGKRYFLKHKSEILKSDYLYFEGNKFKIPRLFLKWMCDDDDIYYRFLAEDYAERKKLVAKSFRYNRARSQDEVSAMITQREIAEYRKDKEESVRDVI